MNEGRDLADRTVVVTGATSGIGRELLRILAERGANVIGVGRSPERCWTLQASVLRDSPDARLSCTAADLASQRQVRRLACDIRSAAEAAGCEHIDVLIHGAEAASRWRRVTEDGYELHFAVNHLAPFLLTHELMPELQAAPSARIIALSSRAHRRAKIRWRDVMHRRGYRRRTAYGQSQLANLLFVAHLNRRMEGQNPTRAYAVDLGPRVDDVGRNSRRGWVWKTVPWGGGNPAQGLRTMLHLATEPLGEDADRIYWRRGRPTRPSAYALGREEAARLWTVSERLCGLGPGAVGSGAGYGVDEEARGNEELTS